MTYLWKTLVPFATDSTGVCSMFADSGALLIGHDPASTVVRGYRRTEERADKTSDNVGLRINEMALILGDLDYFVKKYEAQIREVQNRSNLIILVHSPVSSMINLDIRLCGRMLATKMPGTTILAMETNGNRYYDEGLSLAFLETLKLAADERAPVVPGTVNILGLNTLDYPSPQERAAILNAVAAAGKRTLAVFGMQTDIRKISVSSGAEGNVVVSASGFAAARFMQEKWGIPYQVITDFFDDGARRGAPGGIWPVYLPAGVIRGKTLIIGEQVSANLMRAALRTQGVRDVTVATWFLMEEEISEPGDFHLDSEEQVQKVLSGPGYRSVIADPIFRPFVSGELIERAHPPVSSGYRGRSRYGGGYGDRNSGGGRGEGHGGARGGDHRGDDRRGHDGRSGRHGSYRRH